MKEIKINVSPKVWICILLVLSMKPQEICDLQNARIIN